MNNVRLRLFFGNLVIDNIIQVEKGFDLFSKIKSVNHF